MPFHLWARKTAYELLVNARRDHRAGRRDVAREAAAPDSSSMALADRLAAGGPTPSEAAEARERADQVARAVERLDDDDREILLLRQVDDLPYDEIARLLDITAAAARQRYGRALVLLEKVLAKLGVSGGAA
jgi:RNA polymerase sigma-70 factor (ECF subfamily)